MKEVILKHESVLNWLKIIKIGSSSTQLNEFCMKQLSKMKFSLFVSLEFY